MKIAFPAPQMDDYTSKAKAYWWATTAAGFVVIAVALAEVASLDPGAIFRVALGASFAAIVGRYPIRIPGTKTAGSVAEIFVILLLLEYGPAAASLGAATEAAVISWRTSKRWTSRLCSPAMSALGFYACGTAFVHGQSYFTLVGIDGPGVRFALLLVMALAYFAAGTLLVDTLIKLKRGEPVQPWRTLGDHSWLVLTYASSATIAGLLHAAFGRFDSAVLLASVTVLAAFLIILHVFYRYSEAAAELQAERVATAEHAASESARLLAELRESDERFQSAFTHAAVGMVLVSTGGRIIQVNGALARMLGRGEEDFIGCGVMQMFHPADEAALQTKLIGIAFGAETTFSTELRCRHSDGADLSVLVNGSFFTAKPPLSRCLILQLQDITARRRAEARLEHIAHHDNLTDLPNRSQFIERLKHAIAVVKEHPERTFAALLLDFDRFKLVNDSLGHNAGDLLLIELAGRLQRSLRTTDLVARLGGDEFAILIEGENSYVEAVMVAKRLRDVLAEPVNLKGVAVSTSASIGLTTSGVGYDVPEHVIRDADTAMYRAKQRGAGECVEFDSALHAEVSAQLWIENELRRAIAGEQLDLAYQPIHELRTLDLTGFEALARWNHPKRGPISPKDFIRVAEETGLIIPLGRWVLETACRQLALWQANAPGSSRMMMHINVSGMQLIQSDFAAHVLEAIRAASIDADQVSLELTESVLVENLPVALPHLSALREAGVQVSIDDFGTGYSSFSALSKLPINVIKIDQSFIASIASDDNAHAIVASILALGRTLNKTMIAEGIETDEQMRELIALNCHRGQGYLLGRPTNGKSAGALIPDMRHAVHQIAANAGACKIIDFAPAAER